MLRRSTIGWCDYSGGDLNVVIRGSNCPTSEGCAHCYVERDFQRYGREMAGGTTIYWDKLNRLQKAHFDSGDAPYRRGIGSKPIMFLADYGDLFCEDVPDAFFSSSVIDMCASRQDADWVLLTKRPKRMLKITDDWLVRKGLDVLPANIWCMATVENQRRADERIPVLLQVKAQVRGVSMEPILEPINLYKDPGRYWTQPSRWGMLDDLSWVICGAESGPNRRPFKVKWAEDVYRQCKAAGVAYFGKQASGLRPGVPLLIQGREIKEFPL